MHEVADGLRGKSWKSEDIKCSSMGPILTHQGAGNAVHMTCNVENSLAYTVV